MLEPQITELFVVEDDFGNAQGIMEVTMPREVAADGAVSYWLADGTLVEPLAGATHFIDPDTATRFYRVSVHGTHTENSKNVAGFSQRQLN